MEDVLDSVRRIVSKWVQTSTAITVNVNTGDDTLSVRSSGRFKVGDQVMIRDATLAYETSLVVEEIISTKSIKLTTNVLNGVSVGRNPILIKTINEMFVQGIYIGDPDNISHYPAITVDGIRKNSGWLTLDSTKERYDIEINTYVLESTHEDGYRFLLQMTKAIEAGLKKNIFPLVGTYAIVALLSDAAVDDVFIKVSDSSIFDISPDVSTNRRIIIEDQFQMEEKWVESIVDSETIKLSQGMCFNYDKDDASIIIPTRFIYNSWPADIEYGKIHKGELLKASTIKWFAEEEEVQLMRKQDPQLT